MFQELKRGRHIGLLQHKKSARRFARRFIVAFYQNPLWVEWDRVGKIADGDEDLLADGDEIAADQAGVGLE